MGGGGELAYVNFCIHERARLLREDGWCKIVGGDTPSNAQATRGLASIVVIKRRNDMGIVDFVTGGAKRMMIARPDSAKSQVVYKHPDQTFPFWSQLTVDSDEVCLFFKDGQLVDKQIGATQKSVLANKVQALL